MFVIIQDSQQHVQVEDCRKLSDVCLLLQVTVLNGRVVLAIFIVFGKDCHQRRPTTLQIIKDGHQMLPPSVLEWEFFIVFWCSHRARAKSDIFYLKIFGQKPSVSKNVTRVTEAHTIPFQIISDWWFLQHVDTFCAWKIIETLCVYLLCYVMLCLQGKRDF